MKLPTLDDVLKTNPEMKQLLRQRAPRTEFREVVFVYDIGEDYSINKTVVPLTVPVVETVQVKRSEGSSAVKP